MAAVRVWRQAVMQYIPYSAFPRFVRVIITFIPLGVVPLSRHDHDPEKGSTGGAGVCHAVSGVV